MGIMCTCAKSQNKTQIMSTIGHSPASASCCYHQECPLECGEHEHVKDNVCTGVVNCLCTHGNVILVFISRVVKQLGK